jgi:hypothetical protein
MLDKRYLSCGGPTKRYTFWHMPASGSGVGSVTMFGGVPVRRAPSRSLATLLVGRAPGGGLEPPSIRIQSQPPHICSHGYIGPELLFRERMSCRGGLFGQQLAPVVVQKVVQRRRATPWSLPKRSPLVFLGHERWC